MALAARAMGATSKCGLSCQTPLALGPAGYRIPARPCGPPGPEGASILRVLTSAPAKRVAGSAACLLGPLDLSAGLVPEGCKHTTAALSGDDVNLPIIDVAPDHLGPRSQWLTLLGPGRGPDEKDFESIYCGTSWRCCAARSRVLGTPHPRRPARHARQTARSRALCVPRRHREPDRKCRPRLGGGNVYLARVAVHDRCPGHGQPLAGALPEGLGSKEGLEDAREDIGRDARASIAHANGRCCWPSRSRSRSRVLAGPHPVEASRRKVDMCLGLQWTCTPWPVGRG
jgi:hypothetical protein